MKEGMQTPTKADGDYDHVVDEGGGGVENGGGGDGRRYYHNAENVETMRPAKSPGIEALPGDGVPIKIVGCPTATKRPREADEDDDAPNKRPRLGYTLLTVRLHETLHETPGSYLPTKRVAVYIDKDDGLDLKALKVVLGVHDTHDVWVNISEQNISSLSLTRSPPR